MALVVVLVVLAGLAYAAFRVFGSVAGTADVLDDKVPARSLFYATAYLDPGAGQKINLQGLAGKFPALAGRDLGQTVNDGLEAISSQSGLSFTRDIKPWLGTQIAVAFEPPSAPEPGLMFLVDSKDDERARAGLANAERSPVFSEGADWKSETYHGVELRVGELGGIPNRAYAVVDHTVIVSNEVDLVHDVIDTIQGRLSNLAEDSRYRGTIDDLPGSVLGIAYVNPQSAVAMFEGFSASAGSDSGLQTVAATGSTHQVNQISNPFSQLRAFRGFGMSLSAQSGGLQFDFAVDLDPSKLTPEQRAALSAAGSPQAVLESVPRQAFGVLAISNVKDVVQSVVNQARQNPLFGGIADELNLQGVIGSLSGEVALEIGPGSLGPAGGALLVGTDDPQQMQRFLDNLATQVSAPASRGSNDGSSAFQTEEYRGVTIHFAPGPLPDQPDVTPAYAVANEFGIIASSPDDVKAVIDAHEGAAIAASPTFTDARDQVPEGSQLLYVDVQALLQKFGPQLSQSMGATFSSIVEPNLRPIKAVIVTSGSRGEGALVTHLFLLIR